MTYMAEGLEEAEEVPYMTPTEREEETLILIARPDGCYSQAKFTPKSRS